MVFGKERILTNNVEQNNIKSVLQAIGTMLNANILEVDKNISNTEPIIFKSNNNILKCYIIDYLKLMNRIDGYCTNEEKDKILLLLSDKY